MDRRAGADALGRSGTSTEVANLTDVLDRVPLSRAVGRVDARLYHLRAAGAVGDSYIHASAYVQRFSGVSDFGHDRPNPCRSHQELY